jgi:O-antigen/teichoic acid export membrane protein
MSNTDLLIIGKLLGPAAVVPYACTGKLIGVLANQVTILMHTATPGLCEVKSGESSGQVFRVLIALNHGILAFSGLVFCVVLLVNQWFVTWWVTAGQYGGFRLTLAILVNVLFGHWKAMTAYTVFCFGHQRRISLTNLSTGLVTAASSIGLTIALGPIGAPLGALSGTFLVSLPLNLWRIARDTEVSVPHLIVGMLGGWSWRFLMVCVAAGFVAAHWSPKNLPQAAAAVAGVTGAYLLVMVPDVMDSPLGDYVRPYLTSFRGKYTIFARALS